MPTRVKRTVLTFTSTVAAYLLYGLLVVPFVEPSPKLAVRTSTTSRPPARSRKLDHLFPAGSWELAGTNKIIETDQGTLLFDDYQPLPDGRLKLERCTVIGYIANGGESKAGATDEPVERRPIVLRAPEGATLTFDRPLDVLRGQFGRLTGGRLTGEVTIHSPPSESGRDDTIAIVTRNVQLNAEKISTPLEVRFRYGANSGKGRGLTIFLSAPKRTANNQLSLGIGGLQRLELEHLDAFQLELNDSGLFGRRPLSGSPDPRTPGIPAEKAAFVEVKCQGPFRFDFERQLLRLQENVELVRHNPNGLTDQLVCELLEVYFAEGSPEGIAGIPSTQSKNKRHPGKLMPLKVIASGFPVIIRAASVGIGTQAERVEYDCIQRRVWLRDRDKVMFHDPDRSVEAKELRYALGENGRLGDLDAAGPGVVRGTMGTPPRAWEVVWLGSVGLARLEGEPVLSFHSEARIKLEGTGSFAADALHIYLKETPKPEDSKKVRIEPDRLQATGNVRVNTEKLAGRIDDVQIWFRTPPDGSAGKSTEPAQDSRVASQSSGGFDIDRFLQDPQQPAMDQKSRTFDLSAQLLKALILVGPKPVADRLELKGNVELREVTAGESQPVVIRGDVFELQDGASQHPRAALLGKPAEVVARGLESRGDLFHIYPLDGRFHIVGEGEMNLPAQLATNRKGIRRQPAHVAWKRGMEFDGQVAKFEEKVVVSSTQPTRNGDVSCVAMGELLRVRLTRRIDFRNPGTDAPVELAEFGFDGWGFLELEMIEANGERKMYDQMQVRQLTLNHVTGEIHGQGPGWVRGIHRGRDLRSNPVERSALPQSGSGLTFLRVDFERTMVGNLHHRQLEFLQGTRTLYGPVESWESALDQLSADELPAQALVMTCDRLGVGQTGQQENADQIELEATGNASVQGRTFNAMAGRISYSRAKDQLILEGDGRTKATLSYQKIAGQQPSFVSANKMLFCLSTRLCQITDLQPSEINNVGQLRRLPGGPGGRMTK